MCNYNSSFFKIRGFKQHYIGYVGLCRLHWHRGNVWLDTKREIFYTLRCNSEIYLKSICAVAGLNLNVHLSLIKLTFTLLQVKG